MGRKSKTSPEIKIQVVEEYLTGKNSLAQIAYRLEVNPCTVDAWVRKYKILGPQWLIIESRNTYYPPEIKMQAIADFLNAKGSLREICIRHNISSHSVLQQWIKQYNSDKTITSCDTKGAAIMNTGRKTTYEERMEIVTFCIANANDYKLTSNEYKVSYQQVYGWVKKYEKNDFDELVDRRGKHKTLEELNDSEKQLKLLESENRRLKMENDFLKKLKEIERR
ncbi:helix-turn-helix domain-containing protein [Clostridium gasigenes]|uniref:helix-turn-helix domain-containing protein n=1 Tax=Clostridium gasigenes TaxID=94869 RepID=UPI001C0E8DA3|nr:helix-turn-helix domain-containing protein [Clostridium gasigenes]MBU3107475.1 transposase [Clostridium gasigenes]